MLYNDVEIEVMSTAIQTGMRNPKISPKPFQSIIDKYLSDISFKDQAVLDIGPGQWDFLDIAKAGGATRTVGVDFDPAVCELGKVRGHESLQADFKDGWPFKGQSFDGIFCRGSINVFWFSREPELKDFLEGITDSLKPGGWLWIAPWNKPADSQPEDVVAMIKTETTAWRERHGIESIVPADDEKRALGIGYVIPFVEIWRKK